MWRLRIGGFEAWAKRENVLLGGERAGIYNSDGQVAQVYAYGRPKHAATLRKTGGRRPP